VTVEQRQIEALTKELEPTSRWRPLRALARGGMGEVIVVRHADLGTEAVMKLLRPELTEVPELSQRLRVEARLLIGLSHENLVRVTDFGWTSTQRPFLVTELLHGESLGQRLQKDRVLTPDVALEIIRQVLDGLVAVHAAGIVHRDIKPDNLFLCAEREGQHGVRVKILDFGVAKVLTAAAKGRAGTFAPTATGMLLGTPSYLSPEQAKGERVDVRADLYSVGCLLYRIVAGAPPFVRARPVDVLAAHILDAPKPLSEACVQPIPEALSALVDRALRKVPGERFQTAEEMRAAIAEVARGGISRASAHTAARNTTASEPTIAARSAWRSPAIAPSAPAPSHELDAETTEVTPPPTDENEPTAWLPPRTPRAPELARPAVVGMPRRWLVVGVVLAFALGAVLAIVAWRAG